MSSPGRRRYGEGFGAPGGISRGEPGWRREGKGWGRDTNPKKARGAKKYESNKEKRKKCGAEGLQQGCMGHKGYQDLKGKKQKEKKETAEHSSRKQL